MSALAGSSAPVDTDVLYSSLADKESFRLNNKVAESGLDRTRDELCYFRQVSHQMYCFSIRSYYDHYQSV
ncbi:unnamed protein product [Echinostoma caproni]|uniref:Uncharacterized protein n=1 Tax=Echinostoma caproni TaxID=27848 RepID=A0A3P8HK39_9TREM|nr:unnamed protein product [Echinostoma caproni]